MSEKTGSRNRERTRRALLDAAAKLLRERGSATSLDAIAAVAEVSKSGLLHHFRTRDELLRAVAEDTVETFRAAVLDNLDLSENRPGKLLRAYIRTLLSDEQAQVGFDFSGLWDVLALVDGVTELLIEDARAWREGFGADGLHPERILVAYNAAEGFIAAAQWDTSLTQEMASSTRDTLLAITNDNGPLTGAPQRRLLPGGSERTETSE